MSFEGSPTNISTDDSPIQEEIEDIPESESEEQEKV
jgi:hypothetical protein